jgi:hypothetical protein
MSLAEKLKDLTEQLDRLPKIAMGAIGASGTPMFILDFAVIGALKRTLSLGHGLVAMVNTENMTCARAIVRMQIDTVSRILAYTYVADPEELAKKVILDGVALKKFKSRDGIALTDKYLVDRMTETHSWVRTVYDSTSGEIHFSEKQFFASVQIVADAEVGGKITMHLGPRDTKYPEFSWVEVVACFSDLFDIFSEIVKNYIASKASV